MDYFTKHEFEGVELVTLSCPLRDATENVLYIHETRTLMLDIDVSVKWTAYLLFLGQSKVQLLWIFSLGCIFIWPENQNFSCHGDNNESVFKVLTIVSDNFKMLTF